MQIDGIVPGVAFERELRGDAGRLDAGDRRDLLDDAGEELAPLDRLRVERARRVEVERQHLLDVESLVDAKQTVEARGQQRGDDEQRRADADLETDQPLAQPQAAASFGDRGLPAAQRLVRIAAGEPPRRQHAEHQLVSSVSAGAKPSTIGSTRTSSSRGKSMVPLAASSCTSQVAITMPSAPPATDSTRLSVSSLAELAAAAGAEGAANGGFATA